MVQAGTKHWPFTRARGVSSVLVATAVRARIPAGAALGAALLAGALASRSPKLAVALALFASLIALASLAPALHLTLALAIAVIVPPGTESHLYAVDAFIISGAVRALPELIHTRLAWRHFLTLGAIAVFVVLAAVQWWHGRHAGYPPKDVRAELKVLLPVALALLAYPLVAVERERRRLTAGLLVVGILLGLWGVAQYVLQLHLGDGAASAATDRFSTSGHVVGLYAFPVAALLAIAALTSGHVSSGLARLALAAVVMLNLASLALTFERTFWPALALGIAYMVLRSPGRQRIRLLIGVPAITLAFAVGLSVIAPAEFQALRERIASITNYQRDKSASYRRAEGARVTQRIHGHPITGEGLGASMLIGRPGTTVQPKPRRYAESGYLWLTWKVGIPTAAILLTAMLLAVLAPHGPPSLTRAMQTGSQAALVSLAFAAVNWNIFDSVTGMATLGLLVALTLSPAARPAPR